MTAQWIEYSGSDEQIAEMCKAIKLVGFVTKQDNLEEYHHPCEFEASIDYMRWHLNYKRFTHYLICTPHPLSDMIKRWADTGQPVYWFDRKRNKTGICAGIHTPFELPEVFEYSFTPFDN